MHNELLDTNAPELLEKHAENKRGRKSHHDHHNKTIITKVVDNVFKDNREFSDVPFSHQGQSSSNNNINRDCEHTNDNIGEKTNANLNGTPVNKIKIWKDLVTSHFTRRHHHHQDQNADSESNNNINDEIDDDQHVNAGSKDTRKLNRSKEDSDSASTSYKIKKSPNVVLDPV